MAADRPLAYWPVVSGPLVGSARLDFLCDFKSLFASIFFYDLLIFIFLRSHTWRASSSFFRILVAFRPFSVKDFEWSKISSFSPAGATINF